jgi:16S rRNA (uracil1498-N3)-methyltransferase
LTLLIRAQSLPVSVHRITLTDAPLPQPGDIALINGEEAHHAARVKRLEAGEGVELLDGQGGIASGQVKTLEKHGKAHWQLAVLVEGVRKEPEPQPWLEVCAAAPKGQRLESMVEMLSQVGVGAYRGLEARRTVSDPRPGKLDRVRRVATESAKQCGRAWTMRIARPILFKDAIEPSEGVSIVLADATGGAYEPVGAASLRLLIGPEGGFTENELERAKDAGVRIARFGEHILRIETAAVVASSAVLLAERACGIPTEIKP